MYTVSSLKQFIQLNGDFGTLLVIRYFSIQPFLRCLVFIVALFHSFVQSIYVVPLKDVYSEVIPCSPAQKEGLDWGL